MGELKRRGQIWWIRCYKNGKRCEESSGSTRKPRPRACFACAKATSSAAWP
jgi:hypothetical protein